VRSLPAQVAELRAARARTLQALVGLEESRLEQTVPWRGRPSEVRFHLLGLAEHDDERRFQLALTHDALGWRQPEAARILGLALEVHGHLRAALVGLPAADLDRSPGSGQWTLREVLAHVEQVAERYGLHTAYAVERASSTDDLPMRLPDERLPAVAPAARAGEPLPAILERLDALYDRLAAGLAGMASTDLLAPTIWAGWELDVRFRLLRFSAHERQHAVHAAKILSALEFRPGEAQMILGQAEIARGALLGGLVGLPDGVAARSPGGGLPSILEMLAQAAAEEESTVRLIL
jgi:hypothetical protein